jgi:hypothetical protein
VAVEIGKPGTTPCATPREQDNYWDWIAVDIRGIAGISSHAPAPLTS